MIKKIDNLGRVVIPKGYRQMLGLNPGDPLDVEFDSGRLWLSAHQEGCTFCGEGSATSSFMGKTICPDCISRIRAIPGA